MGATMLGQAATFEDVGNVAAFAASDLACTIAGTNINITSGAVADQCTSPTAALQRGCARAPVEAERSCLSQAGISRRVHALGERT